MKRSNQIAIAFCLAVLATITTRTASAQSLTISFDENGKGTVADPNGVITPLPSLGLTVDPTSGMATLAYDLRANPLVGNRNIFAGDIELSEIPGTPSSDLLRWLSDGRLFVYSDLAESGELPDLADVGLPPNRQNNFLFLTETGPENGLNGLFGYVPANASPGFIGGSGPNSTTYNFTSDTPEPASIGVAAAGGAALLRRRRRARH